jgi:replicative superfamily II helicase
MYNISTEEAIRGIPSISGIDKERLPQILTQKYARIISLKTRYEEGVLSFKNEELKDDWRELNTIANTLELYLIADKTEKPSEKASIAYVAGVARKLMFMIQKNENIGDLSLFFVPEELLSVILFIISGNLPDALELADNFNIANMEDPHRRTFYVAIQKLVQGNLKVAIDLKQEDLDRNIDIWDYVSQLVWRELTSGIKHLCDRLLNGVSFQNEEFVKIEQLSSEPLYYNNFKDVYDGAFILAKLLQLASKQLCNHALIDIPAPEGIQTKDWSKAMRKQAGIRPYLWDNHIKGIKAGILNIGTSSIITFPTGAGKTTLTELKITSTLLRGKRVIYLVPTHALENQVKLNLEKLVNRIISISGNVDGEYTIVDHEEEEIMVMTPERCLTIVKTMPENLDNIGLVVFDEFHLIQGDVNNTRAIDAMILITNLLDIIPTADYCFISAMVQNGQEVADWIQAKTRRNCILLDDPWKPTSQLQGCLLYNKTAVDILNEKIRRARVSNPTAKTPPVTLKREMKIQPQCLFSLKAIWDTTKVSNYYSTDIMDHVVKLSVGHSKKGNWYLSSNVNSVAAELALKFSSINQKTIVFALNPRFALNICRQICDYVGEDRKFSSLGNKEAIQRISIELGGWEESYLSICKYATLHHSHLLPEERTLSESFFKQKDGAMVMVATPTIAQGINLPADVVLIAGSTRYNQGNQAQERIEAHEILNAVGRAGRAGFRSHGTAILIPSKIIIKKDNSINNIWMDLREEVFSKGDRCLIVNDPIGDIISDYESGNKEVIGRFQGTKETVTRHLMNSFFAYKMQKKGEDETLQKILDSFVSNLPSNKEMSFVQSLAEKTGIDENTVAIILNNIPNDRIPNIIEMTTPDLLHYVTSILSSNTELLSSLFHNEYAEEQAKRLVNLSPNNEWTTDAIMALFHLVEKYITGSNYVEIEENCRCKKKPFVDNARIFVLRIIPEISFMCGVFVQIVLAVIEENKIEMDMPKDFTSFASCIKEGVLNYDMLMEKYNHNWMRVECHRKYNK